MKKIPIADATVPQLRSHCELVLGLELPRITNRQQLLAKIGTAAPGTTEIVASDVPESPAQVAAEAISAERAVEAAAEPARRMTATDERLLGKNAKEAASHHYDPRIEVMVQQTPEPGGNRDVQVSVNGIVWLLKRDQFVEVPYRVYEALLHAKETNYTPTNDALGYLVPVEREVFSYPFSTQNGPSEEEVRAWRLRTESVELA